MTFPLNNLGVVRKFNGLDIIQSQRFNKFHCATYIDRIIAHHGWEDLKMRKTPTPMRADHKYQAELQETVGPESPKEKGQLEEQMGFSYCQAIGELIYAHTICRIDISIAIITLSQFSLRPAEIHYHAVKQIFAYLNSIKDYRLTYWRQIPQMDLPLVNNHIITCILSKI